jgi:redox-sensing transcriptional repressor
MRILEEQRNGKPVTSAQVEELTGWPSNTIRKDISFLKSDSGSDDDVAVGSSSGYDPELLIPVIKKALGLDRSRRFCIVGLGRLGSAYLGNPALSSPALSSSTLISSAGLEEFELAAGFDSNVNRVEILKSPVPLYPAYKMAEIIGRFKIEMALLCVPSGQAQVVAEKLAAAGIRGIVNFAPVSLRLSPEIAVRNVFVVDELRELAIRMANNV